MAPAATQFDRRALFACRQFLFTPAEFMISVHERITYLRSELERSVTIDLLPPEPEPAKPAIGSAMPMLFPILTPRKGQVVTIRDVCDGQGNELLRLSHDQHVEATRRMLWFLLLKVYGGWFTRDFDSAWDRLKELRATFNDLVVSDPGSFKLSSIFNRDGQLRAYDSQDRSKLEPRLFSLASLVSSRYLVLIQATVSAGEPFVIRYSHRSPYSETRSWWGHWSEFLGGHPANLRFPVPLSRRTHDYHFYMSAPAGHYFSGQLGIPHDAPGPGSTPGESLPAWTSSQANTQVAPDGLCPGVTPPSSGRAAGAVSESHVYVRNGSHSEKRIDVGVKVSEIPLGSAGNAWISVAVTLVVVATLLPLHAVRSSASPDSNVPALLVALVTAGASISAAAFSLGEAGRVEVISRASIFISTLLGYAFAAWWLTSDVVFAKPKSAPARIGGILADYGGLAILAALLVVFVTMTVRIVRGVKTYRETLRRIGEA